MKYFHQINSQKFKRDKELEWTEEIVNEEFGEIEVGEEEWKSSFSSLPKAYSNDAKMAAILLCDVLGVLCILLNAFVIIALIRNRRRVLVNVFYVMVLHCAIVDLIRGGCLIAWGMPQLLVHTMRSIQDRLTALKINQVTLVILRSCNLLTIFNLLVFTTNEFIVIKYPLHYRRYFRRRIVLFILAFCWLISLFFGIGSIFSNFFDSAHSLMVRKESIFQEKFEWEEENEKEEFKNQTKNSLFVHPKDFTRRQTGGLSINVLSMLMIFVLCYVCLFTVLICYGKILRTIRQFQKCGGVGSRRILKNVGESREEETVALSSHNGRNMVRGSSIYHKRSMHHNQRTHLKSTNNSPNLQPTFSPSSHSTSQIRKSEQQKQQLLLDQYNQHRKKFSTISTAGSPQSIGSCAAAEQGDGGGCGQCHYCTINNNNNNIEQSSRRCNSHRKWRSHLMSRHKYLIVIGTVLFVDVLFLFPYSGIQMVALLHLNNLLATSQMSTLIRWGLQILIGVHSVCQPLCYFRMKEFRRLACCLGVSRPRRYNGSGSSSNFAQNVVGAGGGATHSNRSARSIGSFKAANIVREDDCSTILNPPKKKSIVLSTMFSENGSPPIGSGCAKITEETEKIKYEKEIPMNSSLVGERQMPLIAQRRKWTRNLSLLCKEEGEELQVFLSREYKGEEEKEKFINKKDEENKDKTKSVKKGGSLRGKFYKNEEKLLKESLLEENNNIREGKYWNSLGDFKSEKINDGDDDSIEQIQIKESSPRAQEIIRQCNEEHCQTSQRLLNEESKTINLDQRKIGSKRGGGMFLAVARILGIGWRRRNGRERDEKYWNYNEEPTLLDSDWHRPGEVIKFRSKHKGAELRPRLSDLSGLRSNSVFTPINTSAGNSRHPSNQWSGLMRKK